MGRLRDLATGYQWEKIPNDVRIVMLEEDARIEALEARIAKADALADEMERLVRRTPFVPAPNGISVTIGIDQIADQRIALAAYREGSDT